MEVEVAGELVRLHADRALVWRGTAFVADVHWGKSATFRAHGLPVPDGELDEDLARLAAIAREVDRIVVLGDLVHHRVPPSVRERVADWRRQVRVPFALVRGNHDRHEGVLPAEWDIADLGAVLDEGPFRFVHVPIVAPGRFVWAGHLHPGVHLGAGLRLAAFHLTPELGVLPAFGRFTGSKGLRAEPGHRVYAVGEGQVFAVTSR